MSDIQLTSTVPSNFNHLSIKSKLKEFQFVLKNSTTDCLFATIPFAIQCKMCYHCVGGGEQHCIKRAPMHHQNFYGLQDAKFVIK
uniref:Phorbol-ester/DAG-type domain-containing protein n=1 Tax=Parastrongyloides trichosuri TaxID=131310 RepID=A0A0N4Z786_PARTI